MNPLNAPSLVGFSTGVGMVARGAAHTFRVIGAGLARLASSVASAIAHACLRCIGSSQAGPARLSETSGSPASTSRSDLSSGSGSVSVMDDASRSSAPDDEQHQRNLQTLSKSSYAIEGVEPSHQEVLELGQSREGRFSGLTATQKMKLRTIPTYFALTDAAKPLAKLMVTLRAEFAAENLGFMVDCEKFLGHPDAAGLQELIDKWKLVMPEKGEEDENRVNVPTEVRKAMLAAASAGEFDAETACDAIANAMKVVWLQPVQQGTLNNQSAKNVGLPELAVLSDARAREIFDEPPARS